MIKRLVALVVMFAMVLQPLSIEQPVLAQQVGFTSAISNVSIAPLGEFYSTYTINNQMDGDIIVRVAEEIEGISGSFELQIHVPAGQTINMKGRSFFAGRGADRHVLRYSVDYRTAYAIDDWIHLASGIKEVAVIINTQMAVTYTARHDATVFRGQEVEYTVKITSRANVPIENLVVEDSILGAIGVIPLLEVGEVETLTKTFTLFQTTQGHIILRFLDPITQGEVVRPVNDASVRVVVSEQLPVSSWQLTAEPEKTLISRPGNVVFVLRLTNTGNIAITDIEYIDWNNNIFHRVDRIMPGEEVVHSRTALVEPGKSYRVAVVGRVHGVRQPVQAFATVHMAATEPMVEIERKIILVPHPSLRYLIRNTGNVAIYDIVLEELELGEIARFERMAPGDEVQFLVNMDMVRERISRTLLTAREEAGNSIFTYQAREMIIPAHGVEMAIPIITVNVTVEPEILEQPGAVDVEAVVKNDGTISLMNIEVSLEDRGLSMGSLVELKPGEQETFSLSQMRVEASQRITVLVKGEDEQGNNFEFTSGPLEIQFRQQDAPVEPAQVVEGVRTSFLRAILGAIIILVVLTSGALVYILKEPYFSNKRRRRQIGKGTN